MAVYSPQSSLDPPRVSCVLSFLCEKIRILTLSQLEVTYTSSSVFSISWFMYKALAKYRKSSFSYLKLVNFSCHTLHSCSLTVNTVVQMEMYYCFQKPLLHCVISTLSFWHSVYRIWPLGWFWSHFCERFERADAILRR